jgi:hypothetical protein
MADNWFVFNLIRRRVVRENLSEQAANDLADRLNDHAAAAGITEVPYVPDHK